jgi:hypothetical protein
MKKGLVFILLLLGAAGGGLWFWQQRSGQVPEPDGAPPVSRPTGASLAPRSVAIDYVPVDTALFFGSLEPMSLYEYTANMQGYFRGPVDDESVQDQLAGSLERMSVEGHEPSPGMRLLFGLYAEYLAQLFNPGGMAEIGLADPADVAFYTQGALPVLRLRLGDGAAFDAFVTHAAARFDAKGEAIERDGLSYQRYPLTSPAAAKPVGLIVARHDGFGIITLDLGELIPQETLDLALGRTRPGRSLADSGRLEKIAQANGLLPANLGFIDHAGLLRAVTRTDDPLAVFLDKLSDGKTARSLSVYREPTCRKELEAMAALWPRTVFGYTRVDLQSSPMVMDGVVKFETTDGPLMKALMELRGFLPTYGGPAASRVVLKLGFNVDKLAPTLSSLWSRATNANFTCPPLATAQDGLRQANPALLGIMTGMVQGLRGVSLAIQNVALKAGTDGTAELERLDGLVSISAEHPEQLWGMLRAIDPRLATVPLPEDGQVTDLPLDPMPGIPEGVKLGRYGSHLVMFSGKKGEAAAKSLAGQPLVSNGLYQTRLDYGLFADLFAMVPDSALVEGARAPGAPAASVGIEPPGNAKSVKSDTAPAAATPELDAASVHELAQMRNYFEQMRGMLIDMKLDFVPDGITVGTHIEIPKDS